MDGIIKNTMKPHINEYDLAKSMISQIREAKENTSNDTEKDEPIAITNEAKFGQNVLKNQIDSFRRSVNSGAKFGKENAEDAESNPLVFYPKTGNLVFSGSIPNMSDLKFQFSLNDVTNAPYIFVDGLALTEDVITTLNKLHGYFLNWKESWQSSTDLLDKLKKEN